MIILRYGTSLSIDAVYDLYKEVKHVTKDEDILAIPNDFDILFNCSIEDLESFKHQIEKMIERKRNESKVN